MIDLIVRRTAVHMHATTSDVRIKVGEIQRFAEREAELSGLPGQDQGPADAYRHLVGVAEMARRFGVSRAAVMAEYNETRSYGAMRAQRNRGRRVAQSNTPEARAMDRHNNRLAIEIGATAASPEDVVRKARAAMERAIATHGGNGQGHTPYWRPSRYWSDGESLAEWSPRNWPTLEESDHLRTYREVLPPRDATKPQTGGGPVQVSPHMRDGHPVSGYTRAAPTR